MRLAHLGVAAFAIACVAASAAPAPKPQLLKRQGVVYGVRGINYGGCEAYRREDVCRPYKISGTIVSIFHNPDFHQIDGFTLRTDSGRSDMQNIDAKYFPRAALSLLRPGRRVRVSGVRTGEGRVSAPTEIIIEKHR